MENINYKQLEIIKKFMNDVVVAFSLETYVTHFLKFVFDEKDLEFIFSNLDLENDKIKMAYDSLKQNLIDYNNRNSDDEYNFIKITDSKEFFMLLRNIYDYILNSPNKRKYNVSYFMRSIWLRMGSLDINDVNGFLKRELSFLVGEKIFNEVSAPFREYNDGIIYYSDEANDDFFETNSHIRFSLIKGEKRYDLPVVHYAFDVSNEEPICYIYGIQNISNEVKDEDLKDEFKEERKFLRNGKVSPEFIISLKLFIDLINSYGITNIKVPLLQVYNYPYHESLAKNIEDNYFAYDKEDSIKFEEMYKNNETSDALLDYLHTKKVYDRFVGKEDIISKNKTERLLDIFMIMEEKYNNIEFLNDPFIEGDTLIIKTTEEVKKPKR